MAMADQARSRAGVFRKTSRYAVMVGFAMGLHLLSRLPPGKRQRQTIFSPGCVTLRIGS